MKKLFILIGLSILFSCEKSQTEFQKDENLSLIQQFEKQTGKQMFTKDIILRDNENSMTLRIGSFTKSELDAYLNNVTYSITALRQKQNNQSAQLPEESNNPNYLRTPTIYTEMVDQNMKEGIIGLMVNVKSNVKTLRNAKVNASYSTYHQSPQWHERLHFTSLLNNISFDCSAKQNWWAPWNWVTRFNLYIPQSLELNIDGPRWTAIEVHHELQDGSEYSFWWQNL